MESFCVSLAAMILFAIEKIFFFNITNMSDNNIMKAILKGVILGILCSAYFAVDGLLKLADGQIKLKKTIGFTAQRL